MTADTIETTAIRTSAETRAGLTARQRELTTTIRELIRAQEQLALAAAEGDADAPKRLAANYAEVNAATGELRAIEAAMRQLERREHAERMRASLSRIEANRAAARAAVEAVKPAFERVATALDEVGAALRALQEQQQAARKAEFACRGPDHNADSTAGAAAVFNTSTSIDAMPAVQGRLWLAVGALEGDHQMATDSTAWLDRQIAKALLNIDTGMQQGERYVRDQLREAGDE